MSCGTGTRRPWRARRKMCVIRLQEHTLFHDQQYIYLPANGLSAPSIAARTILPRLDTGGRNAENHTSLSDGTHQTRSIRFFFQR